MSRLDRPALSRRAFLASAAAVSAAAAAWPASAVAAPLRRFHLRAAAGQAQLLPEPYGQTPVWCYGGTVPGPEIRVRQGDQVQIEVENGLDEATTVHWHGLRVPNPMDGVPHLTQPPIGPGESFVYAFDAVDAGTFWYHPHHNSAEQVGRGLYGPLIVEEPAPIRVDRDLTWVLDDWRLDETAAISADFGNWHDMSHSGRIGTAVTINGQMPKTFAVRSNERLRLRLVGAANARIFALEFADHVPMVIALDGQPVAPHPPERGLVVLGPGMRVDIVLDLAGGAGSRAAVVDRYYTGLEYRLVDLVYGATPLREQAPDWPMELPANPLDEPSLADATRHEVVLTGGMMGGMVMQEMAGTMSGGMPGMMGDMDAMMRMADAGLFWFINGAAAKGEVMEPMLALQRGSSHIIAMTNVTAWPHPMHLHGHAFRVIARDGRPTTHREWQDTVLVAPRERVEIALVADNPGDWMFHCHVLEHQASGMMTVIRVA